jgi:hypothetical protein
LQLPAQQLPANFSFASSYSANASNPNLLAAPKVAGGSAPTSNRGTGSAPPSSSGAGSNPNSGSGSNAANNQPSVSLARVWQTSKEYAREHANYSKVASTTKEVHLIAVESVIYFFMESSSVHRII